MIEEEKTQENAHVLGTYCIEELAKLRDEFEIVGDVRGKGLMIGVEMVTDKVNVWLNLSLIQTLSHAFAADDF